MLVLAKLDAHYHQNKIVKSSRADTTDKRNTVDYYSGGNRVYKDAFCLCMQLGLIGTRT